ncbi:MAG TPA: EndoU domain-containing protein [Thermoanaerobaculia bacterium]|nr:EndoU domain-containing protein [Thermoanaerobaculia bacterium]
MLKRSTLVGPAVALALALLLLGGGEAWSRSHRAGRGGRPVEEWSRTSPPINVTHIFEGEINARGKPVGFHSRPGGLDPQGARVVRVVDRPNRAGVYTAEVEIRSGSDWLPKRSTLYPDRLSRDAVVQAVLHAFAARSGGGEKFRGPSGQGFTIEGYYQNGRINTAYPIYSPRE